jgi:hypothetical protein
MNVISRIKSAVREGRYEITEHAIEEAEADDFDPLDLRHAILGGYLVRRYTRDLRATRYVICGPAVDGRLMSVICRFNERQEVRVVTVFAEQYEE